MQHALLPLFPLRVVVFPRTPLSLHIFEERYKEMVGEAIRGGSEFGIVLAREEGIVNAGCTVTVEKVLKQYPDGRMDILTRGVRRFEVTGLNEDKAYLRGEVEFFDDDEPGPAPAEMQQKALTQYRGLLETGELNVVSDPVLTDPQLSFQLAQALQDLDFLSVLLRNRSEVERLKQLTDYLARQIPRLREASRMRKLAPLNGHGTAPSGTTG
ncbi:MAG TPA: LON peptidase substrate-binding domain-containing protein [Bryobacteraceae bacterium]|nr:LON peptidase substrate-binding domain-containing protein [Bryobacteraceae bacterium]